MKANIGVYYAAATTTIITGLLQLVLSSTITAIEKGNPSLQIFFIGIGILQLFWAVGIIRKWGSPFYSLATGLNVAAEFSVGPLTAAANARRSCFAYRFAEYCD